MSNRRNPARYLSVLLCLLSLIYSLPILSLPAKSAEAEHTAYAKPTDEINMNTLYGEKSELEDFSEIRWTGSDHVKSINITQYSGGTKWQIPREEGRSECRARLIRSTSPGIPK